MDDRTIRDLFTMEAMEHIETMETILLHFDESIEQTADIDSLYRCLHTLKGSGNMAGFLSLGDYVHTLEGKLESMKNEPDKNRKNFVASFLTYCDHLRDMVQEHTRPDTKKTLAHSHNKAVDKDSTTTKPMRFWSVEFTPPRNLFARGLSPAVLFDHVRALGNLSLGCLVHEVPSFTSMDPEQCYVAWQLVLETKNDASVIQDIFSFANDESGLQIKSGKSELNLEGSKTLTQRSSGPPSRQSIRALLCTCGPYEFLVPAAGIRACSPPLGSIQKPLGLVVVDGAQETVYDLPSLFACDTKPARILIQLSHRGHNFCLSVEGFDDFVEGEIQTGLFKRVRTQGIRGFMVKDSGKILQVLDLDWFLSIPTPKNLGERV